MKVVFHEDFYSVYNGDSASARGRMESIVEVVQPFVEFIDAVPAPETDVAAVHTKAHIDAVRKKRLYDICALSAGGSVMAATLGLTEPSFGLVRPPGHHASAGSSWGFCYFNNMAIALEALKQKNRIRTAYVLDIDLHYGDGTVNILGDKDYVTIHNVELQERFAFMDDISKEMANCRADIIGISAGFDNHREDWGGILRTEDYYEIGGKVRAAALRCGCGCFGILEGGYNHQVLGQNVLALIMGLSGQ